MDGPGMDGPDRQKLRGLPQVQRLLEMPDVRLLAARYSHPSVTAILRGVIEEVRARLLAPDGPVEVPAPDALVALAAARLHAAHAPGLVRVINATGIILHTNLGRAPLAAEALAAITEAASAYCNLEYDLDSGARGSRTAAVEPWLCRLTGAQAGLAVNNNAAALLLALSALAGDSNGEVIVSRGELVEIGGGFRIPDIIQQGGARLVEVGTTNKTRLADYQAAITPATRVLLKVHQSNFRITGFTAAAGLDELAALARERGLLLVHDLGSGAVADLRQWGREAEIMVQQSAQAGSDVVAFSGDKLLGGPQAGLLVGRAAAIDRLRRHPLLRAVRLDKLSLAALEATLRLHCTGASDRVPALRMISQTAELLRQRAERLVGMLGAAAQAEPTIGFTGGGTMPGSGIPSFGVAVCASVAPEALAARLRANRPAVVGRIADGRLLLDMLTVEDGDLAQLAAAVEHALLS